MEGRSSSVQTAVWEMVEAGGRTAQTFGVSRLLGQIFTFLYLKSDPQSLDQIAESLQVSKASVSIGCRQLGEVGLVRRITRDGDRRDYYLAEQDFTRLLKDALLPAVEKKLRSAQIQIEDCMKRLDGCADEDAVRLREKLEEAESRRARINGLISNPLLRKLL